MDPFTVTTACIGTIAGISQLTSQITNFIRQLKDAQDDMQAVLAQLGAVAKGLEQLRDESTKINYPEDLQQRLIDMVRDCDTVVTSMQRVLDEASNATTARRLQWTLTGKNNMTKLSSRLEAHKTAVVVAVSVASLCLNTGLKSNTDQILSETAALHQQMALMQLQMTTLRQSDSTENVVMQRFMEETTSYAESVIEHHDLASELVLEQAEDRQELRQQPPLIPPHDSALEDTKGPLGLTTIHKPLGEVVADMIFVHGCGGGSRKTWSKNEDPALFWPGEWLSNEPQFRNVRIHTFGYSDNEKSSNLDVPDFAKSLLECFTSAPGIPHKSQTPILLVCHSTGGLVAKKAFLLSRQTATYERFSSLVRSIFFLATPHRGANLANILFTISPISMLITLSRSFVNNLQRNSVMLEVVNEEFPYHSGHLYLFSFYETLPMDSGVKKALVVEKHLATLGYPNERRMHLDADHRGVCKFDSREDPNYRAVRNALSEAVIHVKLQGTGSLSMAKS